MEAEAWGRGSACGVSTERTGIGSAMRARAREGVDGKGEQTHAHQMDERRKGSGRGKMMRKLLFTISTLI